MNEYFLQLVAKGDRASWDKVDEFTFDNWARAVMPDGATQRYSGKRAARVDGKIHLDLPAATDSEIGVVCRILNVKPDGSAVAREGFYNSPEYVKMIIKGRAKIQEIGGTTYKAEAA